MPAPGGHRGDVRGLRSDSIVGPRGGAPASAAKRCSAVPPPCPGGSNPGRSAPAPADAVDSRCRRPSAGRPRGFASARWPAGSARAAGRPCTAPAAATLEVATSVTPRRNSPSKSAARIIASAMSATKNSSRQITRDRAAQPLRDRSPEAARGASMSRSSRVHLTHEAIEVSALAASEGAATRRNKSISIVLPRPTPPHRYRPRCGGSPAGAGSQRKLRAQPAADGCGDCARARRSSDPAERPHPAGLASNSSRWSATSLLRRDSIDGKVLATASGNFKGSGSWDRSRPPASTQVIWPA